MILEFGESVAVISAAGREADGGIEAKMIRELAPFAFCKGDLAEAASQKKRKK